MGSTEEATKLFSRPQSLIRLPFAYCPGCGHGVIHRLIGEVIDELGIAGKIVAVTSIGCSVRMWQHFTYDMCQALHGRAPAVATGLRRALPSDRVIFTYQGEARSILEDIEVVDIVPSILSLFGVEKLDHTRGKVIWNE